MENRTALKENRNDTLIIVWFAISVLVGLIGMIKYGRDGVAIVLILQICFLLYRVLTYCFNSLLLIFFCGKKYKINRLRGRITPIYKVVEHYDVDGIWEVKRFSVHYTSLDLKWSIPFSVLFEEQEYLYDGSYQTYNIEENFADFWEQEEGKRKGQLALEIAEKDKKQQKLDKLNKVFNENYK